jgi:nitroimidazol reductase NimA-like FMN-containing flavoprotein (pyridoxamine 5'-phosphate oxidase superfamily)
MRMTRDEVEILLAKPNIAVLAVVAPDGSPHAVPIWYELCGSQVAFYTAEDFKYKCIKHNRRVTLVIEETRHPPYRVVILKGSASFQKGFYEKEIERLSISYMGPVDGPAYAAQYRGLECVKVSLRAWRIISWVDQGT